MTYTGPIFCKAYLNFTIAHCSLLPQLASRLPSPSVSPDYLPCGQHNLPNVTQTPVQYVYLKVSYSGVWQRVDWWTQANTWLFIAKSLTPSAAALRWSNLGSVPQRSSILHIVTRIVCSPLNSVYPLLQCQGFRFSPLYVNICKLVVHDAVYIVKNNLNLVAALKNWELEICALLEYHTQCSGDLLTTFRDNTSVPSSWVKKSKGSLQVSIGKAAG
jgi:hypothetical protein